MPYKVVVSVSRFSTKVIGRGLGVSFEQMFGFVGKRRIHHIRHNRNIGTHRII